MEADLYKLVFEMTYGISIEDIQNLDIENIKKNVITLRTSYQSNTPVTNYHLEEIRKVYMICYYPYYLIPAQNIFKKYLVQKIDSSNDLKLTFFAAGAAPELIGAVKAINKHGFNNNIIVNLLDLENVWIQQRSITAELIKLYGYKIPSIQHISGCDLTMNCKYDCGNYNQCKFSVYSSDIFIMQNCLNHIATSVDNVEALKDRLKLLKSGAFFLIIDLNYKISKQHMDKIKESVKEYMALVADGSDEVSSSFKIPQNLTEHIFINEDNLQPKRKVKYIFMILRKREII